MPYWYHGTSRRTAHEILKYGFEQGTYFARSMEDALNFGGHWIFEVWFDEDPLPYPAWQWRCPEVVSPNQIHLLVKLEPSIIYRSRIVERLVKISQLEPGQTFCENCQGQGQLEDCPPYQSYWRENKPCTACPECKGHGYLEGK